MSEILAPCGSPETLEAALRSGAGAVYLGGRDFSARQNAVNFSDEELVTAVFACHKRGVRIYRTINTLVFDGQIEELIKAVRHSAEIGLDGLITQDLALPVIVRECCPELGIHASTQMTLHTAGGVETAMALGFSRTVLARELPLETIRELCGLGTEIEVFVHGAQCMSVSGQCFMSAVIGSRSANRGLCAQACRLPCSVTKGREHYGLSLKDMSVLDRLPELERAGVASLKIEGRMKRPEYTALAVDSCRRALRGEDYDRAALESVFSRSGFTDGYLTGRLGRDMFGMRCREDAEAGKRVFPVIHELYRREEKRDRADITLTVRVGEPVELTLTDSIGNTARIRGSVPEPAKSRALTAEDAADRLGRLGDTIYEPGSISCSVEEGLFVSPSELGRLRREGCEELDRVRAEHFTHRAPFRRSLPEIEETPRPRRELRAVVSDLAQLRAALESGADRGAVPLALAEKAATEHDPGRLMVRLPRFTFREEDMVRRLERAADAGIRDVLATNLGHIRAAQGLGLAVHGDFGLNITNSLALYQLRELGVGDCIVSFELKAGQLARLRRSIPFGVLAYGRLPLMLTVNCPIRCEAGCGGCKKRLYDRTGRGMRVACSKNEGYVELLNSELTDILPRIGDFGAADIIGMYFTDETPEEVRAVTERYTSGRSSEGGGWGLYYRGVK